MMNSFRTLVSALFIPLFAAASSSFSQQPTKDANRPHDRECVLSNGTTDAPGGSRAMRGPGESITIRAKPPGKEMRFDQWVGNVEFLADPKSAETKLTMPPAGYEFNHVHVSAAYRSTASKPFLHPLFCDRMVLQRDVAAPVWGWTEPGREVTVELAGASATATADQAGKWLAKVGPLSAGGPHVLKVSGPQSVAVKDVLVGDVWLCSGQSNMRGQGVPEDDARAADYPQVRVMTLNPSSESYDGGEPFETFEGYKGQWEACTPQTAKHFSRAAFYFGEELHKQHKVPVGLIVCAYDGAYIEAWMPKETLAALPQYNANGKFRPTWNLSWGGGQTPFVRFNAHIAPLAPVALRGVLWYQGESNANASTSISYRELLTLMIRDWRKTLAAENLPFVVIQLHGFGKLDTARPPGHKRETWVELQESQLAVARGVAQVGCAVTVDLAKEQSLHPPDKKSIGRRAALVARKVAYGEELPAYGPLYKSMASDGETIRLSFDELAGGLVARDGQPLRYFAIAGQDRKFEWAEAKIVGSEVVVSSGKVKQPVAVRYAWGTAQQEANLSNRAGLPAPAFRTDDWND